MDANHATGVVKFDNYSTAKVLHVQLVRIAAAWKIHDIDYGYGRRTLRGLFKAHRLAGQAKRFVLVAAAAAMGRAGIPGRRIRKPSTGSVTFVGSEY